MRRLALAALAASVLAGPAFAQATAPAPAGAVRFMAVPKDAVLSYNLIGLNVVDGANSTVGEIKDLVMEGGRLVGYVLSVGGFLGMGEHYVAVAPSDVALDYDAGVKKWKATINATKDQLKAAPQFKYEGKFAR